MRAINAIRRAGGYPRSRRLRAPDVGDHVRVRHATMFPFVLAGSIRDDGPLPDTIMDLVEAQDRYAEALTMSDGRWCCRPCCTASAWATCCRPG